MSAGISRVNGAPQAQAFYGYQPLVIKIANTGSVFTADTVDVNTRAITEGGYTKATKIVESLGTIVVQGAQADGSFAAIVDGATYNQGSGVGGVAGATTGFGALKAALAAGLGGTAADYVVTAASTLNGDGTFTFA